MLAACTTTHEQAQSPGPNGTDSTGDITTTDEQIFVGDTVEMSYDPNVIMKRAESYFDKESYAQAIVEYKHFLDLHRNHVLAPYAQYKIGMSHYKQFRTVDRDPEPLTQAIAAYTALLEEFPDNRYRTEAKQTIHTCRELLAQRHLMVGEFYLKRKSYLAAAHRFEKIIKEFPELDTAGDAMFHLAETYQNLGIEEWSQDWLVALLSQHPNNSNNNKAQKLLVALQTEHPQLLASLQKSTPATTANTSQPRTNGNHPSEPVSVPLTHAGILPEASPVAAAAIPSSPPIPVSCAIGTWCKSGSSVPPVTTHTGPKASTDSQVVCKAGEWC